MSSVSGGTNLVMLTKVSGKQVLITILPVVLCILLSLPVGSRAKKDVTVKDSDGKNNETLSKPPANIEEVLSKTRKFVPSNTNDDFWVGSHKLEFKPHPRLMPATQSPTIQQIPIPILELGLPPTLTPDSYSSDDSSEEDKKKGKQRKSRDRRKKSRDQRRLTHRTLWANASNNNAYSIMRAIQNNPNILQQPQYSNLHQPLILTGGSMASPMQPPFMLPQTGRNDESFHGSASTWNVNHPNNQLQSYYSGNGNIGSDSQENRYVQGYPRSASMQNFQIGYPPLQQQQQHQPFTSQQQQLSSAPQHYSMPMSDQNPDNFFSPQQQQLQSSPLGGSNGNGGPIVVYVTPSGRMVTQTSASGPIPLKAFSNINEIPIEIGQKPQLNYNQNYFSGPMGNHVSHSQSGNNPQYMRNNFLRMVMDKLANVGKVLPIPFVTKYSHSPQGYGRSSHLNRRM